MDKRRIAFVLSLLLAVNWVYLSAPQEVSARGRRSGSRAGLSRRNKESKSNRAESRELFLEGETKYNLAEFGEALKLYSRAYELFPHPGFLFNIGQCHRNLGNYDKAVFFYMRYLASAESVPNRKMVENLIKESEKKQKVAALEAKKRKEMLKAHRQKDRREREHKEAETRKTQPYLPSTSDPPLKQKDEKPYYKRWWLWTTIGSGVAAAVITGLALGLSQKSTTVLPSGEMGTIDARIFDSRSY